MIKQRILVTGTQSFMLHEQQSPAKYTLKLQLFVIKKALINNAMDIHVTMKS